MTKQTQTTIRVDEKAGTITLVAPITPRASTSGKSTVLAGTRGAMLTDQQFNGQPVKASFSFYMAANGEASAVG